MAGVSVVSGEVEKKGLASQIEEFRFILKAAEKYLFMYPCQRSHSLPTQTLPLYTLTLALMTAPPATVCRPEVGARGTKHAWPLEVTGGALSTVPPSNLQELT